MIMNIFESLLHLDVYQIMTYVLIVSALFIFGFVLHGLRSESKKAIKYYEKKQKKLEEIVDNDNEVIVDEKTDENVDQYKDDKNSRWQMYYELLALKSKVSDKEKSKEGSLYITIKEISDFVKVSEEEVIDKLLNVGYLILSDNGLELTDTGKDFGGYYDSTNKIIFWPNEILNYFHDKRINSPGKDLSNIIVIIIVIFVLYWLMNK